MARRPSNRQGYVQRPLDLPDSQQKIKELLAVVQQAVDRINGQLTEGTGDSGSGCGNMEGVWWYNTTPGTADSDFTVVHNLGYTPKSVEIRWADRDARVYTSPSYAPTPTAITLRCTASSATLRLKIS